MRPAGPVPRESASRCALQSQLRGDPMLGTAPPARRLLLVEQPGPWGPRGLLDSRADARVAEEIDVLAAAAGMRLQAIRHPGRHALGHGGHVVAAVDTVARTTTHWRVDDLADLLGQLSEARHDDRDTAYQQLLPADAVVDTRPLYLVCTHGRHDACCALRGRPLVRALHALRPGRAWETTHVGGDRFAANLLVLPAGDAYGRVLPFAADDLVAHAERDEVLPSLMRGRLGLSSVAQAALVFGYGQLSVARRDALRVVSIVQDSPSLARVTLDAPDGAVVVEIAVSTSDPAQLTCRGVAGARARVYRGVRITPA